MRKKPQRSPAFQWYPADFLIEVTAMTTDEVGAYVLLKSICWHEGCLPNDVEELASIAKLTPERFQPMWDRRISRCFKQRSDGRWTHPGLDKEAKKQEDWRAQRSAAGIRSGEARKSARKGGATNVERSFNEGTHPQPTDTQRPVNEEATGVQRPLRDRSKSVERSANETPTLQSSSSFSSSSSNKETTLAADAAQDESEAPEPVEAARGPGSLRQRLSDLFLVAYSESHEGARYQIQRPADFVQLDRCLSAQGEISEENWRRAVTNYLASPQHSYTLADLSAKYPEFLQAPRDRYGKPTTEIVHQGGSNGRSKNHRTKGDAVRGGAVARPGVSVGRAPGLPPVQEHSVRGGAEPTGGEEVSLRTPVSEPEGTGDNPD